MLSRGKKSPPFIKPVCSDIPEKINYTDLTRNQPDRTEKMKITFPHMGNIYIALEALLKGLKLDVVVPPPVSKRTIELGIKYSPEFACMPLKINIGNFIEAMENGANTIVMAGGWGPCRFGYYAEVERDILKDLGYDFQMVVLEAPDSKFSDLAKQLKGLGENVTFKEAWQAMKFAWDKLAAVEKLEVKLEYYLPRVYDKNSAERIYEKGLEDLRMAASKLELVHMTDKTVDALEQLERRPEQPLRIGLVGEIYTVFEPASNYHICRELGRLNVEVYRAIYLTDWINDHLLGGYVRKSARKRMVKMARPYLNYWVGGHGQETIGCTVDLARQGFDGIIQIGPLTCMPEIVAQAILPVVSEKEGIPCMTLWFDELSGNAGVLTRIEAFIDMIQRQRGTRQKREARA